LEDWLRKNLTQGLLPFRKEGVSDLEEGKNETIETAVKELERAGYIVLAVNKALPKSFCDVFDVVVKIENPLHRSCPRD